MFYDFSVDTESTLSFAFSAFAFSAFASGAPSADVALNLFSYGRHACLRQGYVAGIETVAYKVPAGSCGVTLTSFAEGALPAHIRVNSMATGSAVADLSLSASAVSPRLDEDEVAAR